MTFNLIDLETWERKEFYLHFINEVRCTYSTTVNLDITNLKGHRLYPAMIWLLTQTVNQIPEFRTALQTRGLAFMIRCTLPTRFSIKKVRLFLGYGWSSILITANSSELMKRMSKCFLPL